MSVMTPYRSPQLRPGGDSFADLLHAEWTKFRTVRGWIIGLLVGALLIIGVGALTGANSICSAPDGGSGSQACPAPPTGPGGEWVTDAFYFVHQPLGASGSITARVTSLTGLYSTHGGRAPADGNPLAGMTPGVQQWAKVGIIIKASATEGSAYAAMMVTGSHGVRMQWDFTNDVAGLKGAVSATSPRWLRLTRSGDVIRGYDSADGTHWTLVGTATLTGLPSASPAGLFAATPGYSQNSTGLATASATGGPALATGTFDNVSWQGASPAGSASRWTGQDIQEPVDNALPASVQGYREAGGTFTVSGSGDIAPVGGNVGGYIVQTLAGTFAGLIAVMVIGVMFMTAEYRRGLVRTTFAASPRRGRVLAAKATVLAAVTFAAGLVAIAITVPLGEHLLHENGNPIYPASALTFARIVVGTAALLAVAAVLALAVGTLLRRSAGAVTAVIGIIVLPYLLATLSGVLPVAAEEWLARVTPAAAFAIQQSVPAYPQVFASYTPGTGYFPLAPWAGFAVLCAWAAAALALAVFVLHRRDV
jgi:ABC-type transport system involved in multi-copper enzyme maturation permease subunit